MYKRGAVGGDMDTWPCLRLCPQSIIIHEKYMTKIHMMKNLWKQNNTWSLITSVEGKRVCVVPVVGGRGVLEMFGLPIKLFCLELWYLNFEYEAYLRMHSHLYLNQSGEINIGILIYQVRLPFPLEPALISMYGPNYTVRWVHLHKAARLIVIGIICIHKR